MMMKLLPLLLAILGAGGGVFLGIATHDTHIPEGASDCVSPNDESGVQTALASPKPTKADFVKLENQFVVPVIRQQKVASMVVLSLSIEAGSGQREAILLSEPKLRDLFLQVLFEHANMGGFDGAFTRSQSMKALRSTLRDAARRVLGSSVRDVLITNINRQDS